MSGGIKQMLAERAALAAPPVERVYDPYEHLFVMIDKAAPFMDEGCPVGEWPPSHVLKIGYFVMTTGSSGQKAAGLWVLSMLDLARERWIDGYHPDPTAKEPRRREGAA